MRTRCQPLRSHSALMARRWAARPAPDAPCKYAEDVGTHSLLLRTLPPIRQLHRSPLTTSDLAAIESLLQAVNETNREVVFSLYLKTREASETLVPISPTDA